MVLAVVPDAGARNRNSRLRRMVVVGDSLLAGFSNGGLVARGVCGQRNGAAALIARQARVSLPQPTMSKPGVPPPLRIDDDDGNGVLDPGDVRYRIGIGFRSKPDREARNLAVPGESIESVRERIDMGDLADDVVSGDADGRDVLKLLILGLPLTDDSVSQLTEARERDPSFLLVWLGANDVLDMATTTTAESDLTPDEFGSAYGAFLRELSEIGAGMAVANLPDVTRIAALRRAADEVTSCRRGDGTTEPVAPDDLLPLDLDPDSLPVPPCGDVLDAEERARIRATVMAFNERIAAKVAAREAAGAEIALVDIFTRFEELATQGYDVAGDGSLVLTTKYLGGVFSLDGIHPSRTGHALIANTFIDAINARFGESIPQVNVRRIASRDPLVGNRYQPAGEPPFGLIEEPEDTLTTAFERIADEIGEIGDDLLDEIEDFF